MADPIIQNLDPFRQWAVLAEPDGAEASEWFFDDRADADNFMSSSFRTGHPLASYMRIIPPML